MPSWSQKDVLALWGSGLRLVSEQGCGIRETLKRSCSSPVGLWCLGQEQLLQDTGAPQLLRVGFAALLGAGCRPWSCSLDYFSVPYVHSHVSLLLPPSLVQTPFSLLSSLFFTFHWTQSPTWMCITAPCACTGSGLFAGECESWVRPPL